MDGNIFSKRFFDFKEKINSDNFDNLTLEELKLLKTECDEIIQQYKNLELVVKKDANSLYGTSASIYFSLVNFTIATDITRGGKHFCVIVDRNINTFFVNWGENELNTIREFYPDVVQLKKFTEYKPDTIHDLCVYGDTDSRYIDLSMIYNLLYVKNSNGDLIPMQLPPNNLDGNRELADFGVFLNEKFIKQIIADTLTKDIEYRNANNGYMKMAHEVTARKGVFQAKKKYVLPIIWQDGKFLEKTKLKKVGVELNQGGLNPRIKKIIETLVNKFLLEDFTEEQLRVECVKLINYIRKRNEKSFIYRIQSVNGLNVIEKNSEGIYVSPKTHIGHKNACFWYNFIETNQKAKDLYQRPFEGQKMNFYYDVYGKTVAVPDDVDIDTVSGLPEPDYTRMLKEILVRNLLKYILNDKKINMKIVDAFLIGVKKLKF